MKKKTSRKSSASSVSASEPMRDVRAAMRRARGALTDDARDWRADIQTMRLLLTVERALAEQDLDGLRQVAAEASLYGPSAVRRAILNLGRAFISTCRAHPRSARRAKAPSASDWGATVLNAMAGLIAALDRAVVTHGAPHPEPVGASTKVTHHRHLDKVA